ncbi:MAG TPA: PxKF domain-containing protein, partial [Gaiellaceae bacterium]|nr:PxKF domain-containing protein [Gaiellaceae bacterium]
SLGGDRGLEFLAAGSPSSQRVDCDTLEPLGAAVPIGSPGGSVLEYDPVTDTYGLNWRTAKAWAGTCRALTVALDDGTEHVAYFRFG